MEMISKRDAKNDRRIAYWLFAVIAMVFVMIVLGGLTRLTHSGLSMVDWRPVTGWLPPLNPSEWSTIFELYKQTPQFKAINFDMNVDGFKSIFWLEYVHRLWGRVIGVVFLLPFLYFLARRQIARHLAPKLALIFLLGGLKGGLGWFMVKSGLVYQPDVSQYRLTAHLAAAVVILGYMLWVALPLIDDDRPGKPTGNGGLKMMTSLTTGWIFITILSGGFVAGLDGGLSYNTFPLMDGLIMPDGLMLMAPWYLNLFENVATVQFDHRIMAEITFLLVASVWYLAHRSLPSSHRRLAFHLLAAAVVVQLGLGISTLLLVVPISLAAMHQAGAMILFLIAIWTRFETR